MQKFTSITAIPVLLERENVDTDQIYPKQFLRTIQRQGLGQYAFYDMRFDGHGAERADFFLVNPSAILIAGKNFGSGSSREHAVWCLMDLGIRVIIAESFGDIFYNNGFKNGLLAIKLQKYEINTLKNQEITVNLEKKSIKTSKNQEISFEIDDFYRHCLLNGLDDIALTLEKEADIAAFEAKMQQQKPWIKKY